MGRVWLAEMRWDEMGQRACIHAVYLHDTIFFCSVLMTRTLLQDQMFNPHVLIHQVKPLFMLDNLHKWEISWGFCLWSIFGDTCRVNKRYYPNSALTLSVAHICWQQSYVKTNGQSDLVQEGLWKLSTVWDCIQSSYKYSTLQKFTGYSICGCLCKMFSHVGKYIQIYCTKYKSLIKSAPITRLALKSQALITLQLTFPFPKFSGNFYWIIGNYVVNPSLQ